MSLNKKDGWQIIRVALGRGSILWSEIKVKTEIRKIQSNKESVTAVFFDTEKAYNMMWKEGLLIKQHNMGV